MPDTLACDLPYLSCNATGWVRRACLESHFKKAKEPGPLSSKGKLPVPGLKSLIAVGSRSKPYRVQGNCSSTCAEWLSSTQKVESFYARFIRRRTHAS